MTPFFGVCVVGGWGEGGGERESGGRFVKMDHYRNFSSFVLCYIYTINS